MNSAQRQPGAEGPSGMIWPGRIFSGRTLAVFMAAASVTACATPHLAVGPKPGLPRGHGGGSATPAPTAPGTMRPYQVRGRWYKPQHQPGYDEVGIASWYGQQFHNRKTASGEPFDMTLTSAAHKTLPLPSIVEVTNLDNGRKARVRVNDRGPFVEGRIIDMSKAGAEALGFASQGSARVRVRYIGPAPTRDQDRSLRQARVDDAPRPGRGGSGRSEAPGNGPWSIQAGSFSSRDNARNAMKSLNELGRVQIRKVSGKGQTWFRVVVTSGSDLRKAERLRQAVAAAGFPGATLISGR